MGRLLLSVAAILSAATVGLAAAQANELEDVENARGNARAGGPTNGYDAYLLNRYGALSGTRDSTRDEDRARRIRAERLDEKRERNWR